MKFITLSGTDGSGKSTQLELLLKRLKQDGRKVAVFHALEFSIGNRALRFLKGEKGFRPGTEKANASASNFTVFLRTCSLFVDLVAFRPYVFFLKRAGYDILLSDRYFSDTIVNILYLSDRHRRQGFWGKLKRFLLRFAERRIVRPEYAFLLDISPESVMHRENAPEQGIDYISKKRELFHSLVNRFGFIVIDADREKSALFADIYHRIDTIKNGI